ncbi:uncharacterized protein LOC125020899 [Mugil cephalus]|uniref:uncharacterized protein LOC125020899 n=1 Tax=Mugil cephalus TaxID=48193 RepID=UPI001FB858CB|nr:uncharacterized protein LOC125020899 [Mugil cephalus]
MFSSKQQKARSHDLSPSERFVTTYAHDFKPVSERGPQLNRKTPAKPAPALISLPQNNHETWPVFFHHFYNTTNGTYGSALGAQPLSCSLSGGFGSTATEARTQEPRVARETGISLNKEDKANAWKAKNEPQWKTNVLYQEGVVMVATPCCEDFIRNLCRETGLRGPVNLPVASRPVATNKDENWETGAFLWGLSPAIGLNGSSFLHPSPWQCSCCAWGPQQSGVCCFETQNVPAQVSASGAEPAGRAQPHGSHTESGRMPLTEYQASYGAEWAKPKVEQSDSQRCLPRHCRRNPRSSV